MTEFLLTDAQVQQFISEGYLVIQSSLPEEIHSSISKETLKLFETEGNPGNNIFPKVKDLEKIFQDEPVAKALESLIGRNYIMQPHRHPHLNKPGSNFQQWHKDSFFGFMKPCRNHQLKNVMAMYYPQKTTVTMAPTGIKPQTQYSIIDPKKYRGKLKNQHKSSDKKKDISMVCEAGSVVIIHYDLIHR
jgi:O-acetylhomoserine/O-acetylserine sulfhydrylase-like pyridoxal-dependent enzyme